MRRFAEVAVDVPAGSDRTFSYSVPESLFVLPGHLVRVPFGPRTLQGIVFSVDDAPQVTETRDIIDVQGPAPHLDEARLSLARWLSRYYRCSLFEAAAQMLPPGGRIHARTFLSAVDENPEDCRGDLTPFQRSIVGHIRSRGRVDQQRLARRFGDRATGAVASLVRRGIVSQTVAGRRPAGPKRLQIGVLTDLGRREGPGWIESASRVPRQPALLRELLDHDDETPLPELRKRYGASTVKGLIDKEYIEKRQETAVLTELGRREGPCWIESASRAPRQLALLRELLNRDDATPLPKLRERHGASAIKGLVDRGYVEKRVETALLTELGRREGPGWIESASHVPRQPALLRKLLDRDDVTSLPELRKKHGASAVKGLIDRGYIEKRSHTVLRDPLGGRVFKQTPPVCLTSSQTEVADSIRAALEDASASPRAFVLQGVTGSGKTEVYLAAAERCLSLGRKAVVLVPEIALTHQTVERFASRFPGRVAVLHSGISDGERFDQWWQTRQGAYDIVIGSRSAIFAPLPDVGLIVIDEEHEWTYKQVDARPRYHARDAAMKLAELTGAVVVMGSASPDLVSYHAALRGRVGLLVLPDRVRTDSTGAPMRGDMPGVQVVDMRRELREGNRGSFSRRLDDAMSECLRAGQQMVLFVNRRGSASHVQCRSCGYSLRCRRCDIALTYHRSAARLICHYCGERRKPADRCPRCMAHRISYSGTGTESVEREISDRFPAVEVLRLDSDTTRSAGSHERLLSRFGSGEARVLVGTQMVTKGLHFPDVTLVGVISADVGLNIPDYRSGERAFQLLCQVAGRAGRGASEGTVIVQTYQPDNYAIQAAAAQDYAAFYSRELSYRRQQGNPPFGRMVRLLHTHTNRARCEAEASRLATELRTERDAAGWSDIDILGPTPAYPPRVRGRYRWHIILRGAAPRRLLESVAIPPGWTVDVDPVAMT